MTSNREPESRKPAGRRLSRKRAQELLDRAQARPGAAVPPDAEALERLLAVASRPLDEEPARAAARQEEALAAFRAARNASAPAPTRPQDDWRSAAARRADVCVPDGASGQGRRSAGALAGMLAAASAVCGVAVAAAAGVLPDITAPSGAQVPGVTESVVPRDVRATMTAPAASSSSRHGGGARSSADRARLTHAEREALVLCGQYERAERAHAEPPADVLARLDRAAGSQAVPDYCAELSEPPEQAEGDGAGKGEEKSGKGSDQADEAKTGKGRTGRGQNKGNETKAGPGNPGNPGIPGDNGKGQDNPGQGRNGKDDPGKDKGKGGKGNGGAPAETKPESGTGAPADEGSSAPGPTDGAGEEERDATGSPEEASGNSGETADKTSNAPD